VLFATGEPLAERLGACQRVALEGLLDAPGDGGADALVDRECLLQVHRAWPGLPSRRLLLCRGQNRPGH
jgi:hypothetical protein